MKSNLKRNNFKLRGIIFSILFSYFLLEICFRLIFSQQFAIPFFSPDEIVFNYYPELKELEVIPDGSNSKSVLVLGGSVLFTDSITLNIDNAERIETFCNLPYLFAEIEDSIGVLKKDRYHVYNLAQPGHTSLDSKYKYKLLKNLSFDYVFFYHGINDFRANNCSESLFDVNYRHMEFYNELYVIFRHPLMNLSIVPFSFDWIFQQVLIKIGKKKTIPKEQVANWNKRSSEVAFSFGKELKTKVSFENNLSKIAVLSTKKRERLLIGSYASYIPIDYSLEAFLAKKLDYDAQIFPVELYGDPTYVSQGINAHNGIGMKLAARSEKDEIYSVEINNSIAKKGLYFDDVCHLSDLGCEVLAKTVYNKLVVLNED